jgi:MYXO-CTERM domain-containing protein
MARVLNPGSGAPSLSALINIPLSPIVGLPFPSPHQGSTGLGIDSGDGRLLHAHTRGGRLYTSHTVGTDAAGAQSATPDRNGTSWYEIAAIDGAPNVAQRGVIHDSSGAALNYIWGSFMTSGQGHAAFGMTLVGATSYASAATLGRLTSDPAGTVQYPPVIYQPGQASYNLDFGNPGSLRWGDYSYTSLDPCDDMTMWTIQEYAFNPPINFAGEIGQWGVIAARLLAPPPVITGTSPAMIPLGQASVGLTLVGTGFYDPIPWPGETFCLNRLQVTVSGVTGLSIISVTYVSPTQVDLVISTAGVLSGGSGSLTLTNPDGQTASILFGVGNVPPASAGTPVPTPRTLPATGYPPAESDGGAWPLFFGGLALIGAMLAGVLRRRA